MLVERQWLDLLSEHDASAPGAAGEAGDGDVVCVDCGYGIVVRTVLPRCPMCRGLAWKPGRSSGFAAGRRPAR